jgi:hypothetical protein
MPVLLSLSSEERLGQTRLGRDPWAAVTKAKQPRSFLGDEDFFSLLREVDCTRSSKTVSHTIRSRIERFAQTTGIELPPSCFELYDILADEVFPPCGVLSHEVPDWIHIDSLDGMGPVLGSGTCLGWKWEFRARHERWAIWAAPADSPNLDDGCPFEYGESYGVGPSDASVMSFEDARYFIVRELTRLAREQGLLEDPGFGA